MKGEPMQVYDRANELANEIRQCEDVRALRRMKEELQSNDTARALIKEYKRLQMQLQMAVMAGVDTPPESAQRFGQLSTALFSLPEASGYLLTEMRVQQMLSDVYKLLNEASGIDLPGM